MKKNTVILILCILVLAGGFALLQKCMFEKTGNVVIVTIDGKETGTYSLEKNQRIVLNEGTNVLTIQDGCAKMTEANCPDHICMKQKKISKNGESIICLPNKIVVTVSSEEENEMDSITG